MTDNKLYDDNIIQDEEVSYISQSNKENSMDASKFSNVPEETGETLKFKIVLLGNSNVGKTSIINKFILDEFKEGVQCTLKTEFKSKTIKIGKALFAELTIWDTCGNEKYFSIAKSYYLGSNGVVLVYDVTDESSFYGLDKWVEDLKTILDINNTDIILVGNKIDSEERKVSEEFGKMYAQKYNFSYIEASAKEGNNIQLIFDELARMMSKKVEKEIINESKSATFKKSSYIAQRQLLNKKVKEDQRKMGCC